MNKSDSSETPSHHGKIEHGKEGLSATEEVCHEFVEWSHTAVEGVHDRICVHSHRSDDALAWRAKTLVWSVLRRVVGNCTTFRNSVRRWQHEDALVERVYSGKD